MIGEIDVRDTICPSEVKAFANALMKSVCLTHTHAQILAPQNTLMMCLLRLAAGFCEYRTEIGH